MVVVTKQRVMVRVHALAIFDQQRDGGFFSGRGQHLLLLQLAPLGLVAAVLEPNLHLRLRQLEGAGQLRALGAREVALMPKTPFQLVDLAVREGGAGAFPPCLAACATVAAARGARAARVLVGEGGRRAGRHAALADGPLHVSRV